MFISATRVTEALEPFPLLEVFSVFIPAMPSSQSGTVPGTPGGDGDEVGGMVCALSPS